MWLKLKQFALSVLLLNSFAFATDISQLDGDWYSFKWKYGYSLSKGKGVAFATNSPNFKVGQEIIKLTAVGKDNFVGENIYKDGKFYKVKATLQSDGKLLFEGEKNVKWEMEKIDPETFSSIVNAKPEKQAKKIETETADTGSFNYAQTPNHKTGICIGFISKEIETKGAASVDARYMKYLRTKNKSVTDVINTQKNYSQCFEGGVIISDCLQASNVNSKIIGLMLGFNTGITNYKDTADRAVMSLACVE